MLQLDTRPDLLELVHDVCRRSLLTSIEKTSSKFRQENYVSRAGAEMTFQRYLQSDKELFLVLSESGLGKTNLMCHLAVMSIATRPALLLTGMWRDPDAPGDIFDYVFKRVKDAAGRATSDTRSFIDELDEGLRKAGAHFLVFIDGINETEDAAWAKRGIRELLMKCPKTFRFVLSCRTDSFRLYFQDAFWAEYIYQEKSPLADLEADKNLARAFKDKALTRFDRVFTPEQKRAVENALREQREAEKAKRAQRLRELATEGSLYLQQFNEAEFNDALVKYGINAKLVGDALQYTHNPLVFRFFAETVGKEDREISDVFTLENAQRYLDKHVQEATRKGYDKATTLSYIFEVARQCRKQYGDGDGFVGTAPGAEARPLANALIESGLLMRRGEGPGGGRERVSFTYDRVLSFVLASEADSGGGGDIVKRLKEIYRERRPPVIDIHQCLYLLLFLEEQSPDDASAVQKWVHLFLGRNEFGPQVVQMLPEFKTWPAERVIGEVRRLLLSIPYPPRKRLYYGERDRVWDLDYFTPIDSPLVSACADALSTLARKGHAAEVIRLIEGHLIQCSRDERLELFYPLVKPAAVAFQHDPDRCMSLLKQLCHTGEEVEVRAERSRRPGSPPDREEAKMGGILVLQQEVESFPRARLPLIKRLAASAYTVFRAAGAAALPGLYLASPGDAAALAAALADDQDFRVRSEVARAVSTFSEQSYADALSLCSTLLDDRSDTVRSVLVESAVALTAQGGQADLSDLLKSAAADESTYVRMRFTSELAAAISIPALESAPAHVFKRFLEVLAADRSNLIRAAVVNASRTSLAQHPAFWVELITRIVADDAPAPLKESAINILTKDSVPWAAVEPQASALAALLADDADESIRAASPKLLDAMARQGNEHAKQMLARLVNDPRISVRVAALDYQQTARSEVLAEVLREGGDAAYAADLRHDEREALYLSALARERVSALKENEVNDRFWRNVGAGSILLLPFLGLVGVTGWSARWLGNRGDGVHSADPRYSAAPLILGIIVATVVFHIQQWSDLHFYSHRARLILSKVWPFLVAPVVLGVGAGVAAARILPAKDCLLLGLSVFAASLIACSLAAGVRYTLASPPWTPASLTCMVAIGYLSGAAGGWFAEVTREDFYGFFLLLCPLLLNLRTRGAAEGAATEVTIIALFVSLIPVAGYFIGRLSWLTNAATYQWTAQHFGASAATAGVLSLLVTFFCIAFLLMDEAPDNNKLLPSGFILLSLVASSAMLVPRVTIVDTLAVGLLLVCLLWLVWMMTLGIGVVWPSLLCLLGMFVVIDFGLSLMDSPWLLPGLSLLLVVLLGVVRWSYLDSSDRRVISGLVAGSQKDEGLLYQDERTPLKFSVLASLLLLPLTYGASLLAAAAAETALGVNSAQTLAWLSVICSAVIGLLVIDALLGTDAPRRRARRASLCMLLAGLIASGVLLWRGFELAALLPTAVGLASFAFVALAYKRSSNLKPYGAVMAVVFPLTPGLRALGVSPYVTFAAALASLVGLYFVSAKGLRRRD
jgi:hypothetical protein